MGQRGLVIFCCVRLRAEEHLQNVVRHAGPKGPDRRHWRVQLRLGRIRFLQGES